MTIHTHTYYDANVNAERYISILLYYTYKRARGGTLAAASSRRWSCIVVVVVAFALKEEREYPRSEKTGRRCRGPIILLYTVYLYNIFIILLCIRHMNPT